MCTGTEDTGTKKSEGGMSAMAGMMESCDCAGMMAKMMASCLGSAADRAAPADNSAEAGPSDDAGPEGRKG